MGTFPEGIAIDDMFAQNNAGKFKNIPETQNNLKLYKLAIVETEKENGEKVLSLAVPTNEKSILAAVGKSALEIAIMVAQGQGAQRQSGANTLGGDAITYFQNNLKNFRDNGIKVPFMEQVNAALKDYLAYCNDLNDNIKAGLYTPSRADEIYNRSGLEKYAVEGNTGVTSPYFHKELVPGLTKRADIKDDEYEAGLDKIPYTAQLSIERLASLYKQHFAEKQI